MSLLGNKQLEVGEISVHLMKDKWLDPHEFNPASYEAALLDQKEFPQSYPLLNHPSTILLLKGQT